MPATPFSTAVPQINSYFAKDYLVNLKLHVDGTWLRLQKRNRRKQLKSMGIVETQELNQSIAVYMEELEVPDSVDRTLRDIYHSNFVLMQYGIKQFNLAPHYTTRAKYITIDTDALHSLVKSNISKSLFGSNQTECWQQFTNIKPKYFRGDRRFNMMVTTNGVGCSVVMFRDKMHSKTASSAAVRKKRKVNERQSFLDSLPEDITWVGSVRDAAT